MNDQDQGTTKMGELSQQRPDQTSDMTTSQETGGDNTTLMVGDWSQTDQPLYDPNGNTEGATALTSSDDCQTESDSEDDKENIPFIRWGREEDNEQTDIDRPVFQMCGKTVWVYGSLVAERKVCFPFLGCSCCCFWTAICCLINVMPALHEHTL